MKPRICLNMIVKDEARIIARCLDSVLAWFDTWLIVDTGSSDGTPHVVREYMARAGKPGELVPRPWRDFGYNRSEALELARPRASYTLVIDADEILHVPANFELPELTADCYQTLHRRHDSTTTFWLSQLVSNALPFRYEGVLHEVLVSSAPHEVEKLVGPLVVGCFDSARNQIDAVSKYSRDAAVLERALATDPTNARYQFYLAQSYRDANDPERAIAAYKRRAAMSGFEEEGWYAQLQVARLSERVGRFEDAVTAWLAAYQRRPSRAEPLCDLARFHRQRGQHALALLFAEPAAHTPAPADVLFLDEDVYRWRALDEYAVACYWKGDYEKSVTLCDALLCGERAPATEFARLRRNLEFAEQRLRELGRPIPTSHGNVLSPAA